MQRYYCTELYAWLVAYAGILSTCTSIPVVGRVVPSFLISRRLEAAFAEEKYTVLSKLYTQ